jgi:hypothetical protein
MATLIMTAKLNDVDPADREDVNYRSHCQAARLACALDPRQFHGSNSSSL